MNISATLKLYIICLTKALRSGVNSPALLIGSLVLALLFWLGTIVIHSLRLGMAGGFALGLLASFLLSFFYSWLRECIINKKISWKELTEFNGHMFLSIINVGFLFWMISLFTSLVLVPIDERFSAVVSLLTFILFNVTAEIVYLRGATSINAFTESIDFVKENWIEWFIPLFIVSIPFFLVQPWSLVLIALSFTPFVPIYPIMTFLMPYLGARLEFLGFLSPLFTFLLVAVIGTTFMLFRGYLFDELSNTSKRSRAFLARSKE